MTTDLQIIHNGHVARLTLQQFAKCPDDFDDDTIEEIWQHLDVCDDCMDAYDNGRKTPSGYDKHGGSASRGAVTEPGSFSPEDLVSLKPVTKSTGDADIEDSTPAGDERAQSKELEKNEIDDVGENESSEDNIDNGPDSTPENAGLPIEGLVSGQISELTQPATRVETETLADEEERMTRDNIQAYDEPDSTDIKTAAEAPDAAEAVPEPPGDKTADDPGDDPHDRDRETEDIPRPAVKTSAPRRPAVPKATSASARRTPAPPKTKAEPLEDLIKNVMTFLRRPRNLAICCGAAVVTAAAIVISLMVSSPDKASPVSGWAPLNVIESRVPLQEVRVRRMSNGRIPNAGGTDVTLNFTRINKLVIAVDLDYIKGNTSPYWLTVFNPAGESVFEDQIPQIYLDDGRFFLRLIPKLFEQEQTYKLHVSKQLDDGRRSVIAESVFDVVK